MARVVQRSSPPYLAILFVFLFIIAAGFAAWFYTEWRDAETQAATTADTLNSLASRGELSGPDMAKARTRARDEGRSVVGQYRQEVKDLIGAIVGAAEGADASAQEAIAGAGGALPTIDETLADVVKAETEFDATVGAADRAVDVQQPADGTPAAAGKRGLLQIIKRLAAEQTASKLREMSLQTLLNGASEQMVKAMKDAADTQKALSEQLSGNREELTALQAKFDELSGSFQSNIATANSDWDSRVQALQNDLATQRKEILNLQTTIEGLQTKMKTLEGAGLDRTSPDAKPELLADGEVLKVLDAGDHTIAYINIGSDDRVRVGLTFTVYGKHTGVSAEAEGKGVILVKSVSRSTAECLVLRSMPTDPMTAGDLVANLAFSSARQPVFVVEGNFDLDADGIADSQGAETVKSMISRFGGRIADTTTVDTDYVVMGMEPRQTARPDTDAPPTEIALWQESQTMVQKYRDLVGRAVALNKPILNTDQLLTYIGFAPEILEP